ncbi:MAG: hypothetical protein LH471_01345 [Salinibacterium sp.]|nr:hypothetical protein [Salinibacterium sp.]
MTIVTKGSGLTASVEPARGGKIVSLIDEAGSEWLAQTDPIFRLADGASFVESEMAGWDECAPSIVACTIRGRDVPDHGDLWNTAFDTDGSTVRAFGVSLGYRFERTITATDDGVMLHYLAESVGETVPFLWAAHPQFSALPGTRVELAAPARVVDVLDPKLPISEWSPQLATIDTVPHEGSRKWFVEPDHPVEAASIVRADGSSLTMRWSPTCPYLGVWFDSRAYSREPVIAIEPSTGYFDSLESAVYYGRVALLTPGAPLAWWVSLQVTTGRTGGPEA